MQMRHKTGGAVAMAVAGLLGLGVEANADPVMPGNPISGWTFDGHLEDAFGGNDGEAPNGIVYTNDGPFGGQALDLTSNTANTANQKYVDFGNPESLQMTTNMTVATWIHLSPSNNWTYAISKYISSSATPSERQWAIAVEWGRYKARFGTPPSGTPDLSPKYENGGIGQVNDSQWHHLAFTIDENNGTTLYIDGVKVDEWQVAGEAEKAAGIKQVNNTTTRIVVGASGDPNSTGFFRGQIGETAIWDTVLSDDEIAWLAQNSFATIPEPGSLGLLGAGAAMIMFGRRK